MMRREDAPTGSSRIQGHWQSVRTAVLVLALFTADATAQTAVDSASIEFRLVDDATNRATTAMVCIENLDDGTVRLPPRGDALAER